MVVETPILSQRNEWSAFEYGYDVWLCKGFVEDHFECVPKKVSLSFSTQKSEGALAILFKACGLDDCLIWKVANEEFTVSDEFGYMFDVMDKFLLKHFKFNTTGAKKLYVTLYDRTEA